MQIKPVVTLIASSAVIAAYLSITSCGSSNAATNDFTLTSPDLAVAGFTSQYILTGFGCTGGNISPEIQWANPPDGTKSFALNVFDPDAPSSSGFWHWAVYNIPASATGLA